MPQLGNLIKSLATKAGVKLDDETLKKILAVQELSTLEVPDEFNAALEGNLLTEASATANSKVRAKIIGEAFNGIDSEFNTFTDELEFDDNTRTAIKAVDKNTNEKFRKIKDAVKELVKQKTGNKKDDAVLQKEIERLNGEANKIKTDYEAKINQLESKHHNDKIEWNLQGSLATKPLPKNGLPAEVNILTAKTLVQQEMAKNGLKLVFDAAGNPTIKQQKDGTELDYYVNNKPVAYSDFIDGVLAQNKFIQVNDQSNQQQQQQGPGNNSSSTSNPTNQSAVASADAVLAQLGAQV